MNVSNTSRLCRRRESVSDQIWNGYLEGSGDEAAAAAAIAAVTAAADAAVADLRSAFLVGKSAELSFDRS